MYPRGNHLSNTTCLTQVFLKSGEERGILWWPLTLRKAHKANVVNVVANGYDP